MLHLVAGTVNKDLCNFIYGESRMIIVHKLLHGRSSGRGPSLDDQRNRCTADIYNHNAIWS